MEFVNTKKNDLYSKVKLEIPESSKCWTIIIKSMIWQIKIRKKGISTLLKKKMNL